MLALLVVTALTAWPVSALNVSTRDKAVDKVLVARAKARGLVFTARTQTVLVDVDGNRKADVVTLWDSTDNTGAAVQSLSVLFGSGASWKLRGDAAVGKACGRRFESITLLTNPRALSLVGTQPATGAPCTDTSTVVKTAYQLIGTSLNEVSVPGTTGVVPATPPPDAVNTVAPPTAAMPTLAPGVPSIRQFGTPGNDESNAIAIAADGSTYIAGRTSGGLDGQNKGLHDAFVRKYDRSGEPLWTRQFGSPGDDGIEALALAADGSIYVTGYANGALTATPAAGGEDIFLTKLNPAGDLVWTRQVGTSGEDSGEAIAVSPAGTVLITGYTTGSFSKMPNVGARDIISFWYTAAGDQIDFLQLGTTGDDHGIGATIAGDESSLVIGDVNSSVTYFRFNSAHDVDGIKPVFGTTDTAQIANAIATGAGGSTYLTGYTTRSLEGTSSGRADVFLTKVDAAGNVQWTRQFGTEANDGGFAIAVAADGSAYVAGGTNGSLSSPNAGNSDVFVRKYDSTGAAQWTRQLGTASDETAYGIALGSDGRIYLNGTTTGDLGGPNAGPGDVFLVRYDS
jgi:hypothetical protein